MPRRLKPPRHAQGFTLLEVIIALALTSLLALLGALLVRTATDHFARGNNFLGEQEQTRLIARLFTELGGSLIGKEEAVVGQPLVLEMTSDKLPLGMNLPGRQKLRLQCEPDPEAKDEAALRLVLRVLNPIAPVPGAPAKPMPVGAVPPIQTDATDKPETFKAIEVLGKNLRQCSFSYLRLVTDKEGAGTGRWEEAWLGEHGRAPLAIRLTLETARGAVPPFVVALVP